MHIHKKHKKKWKGRGGGQGGGGECPGLSRRSPRTATGEAGGGPGAITAIFSILKPRMSAENAPVFAMFVRLQNKQNEPAGSLEVAWGLFWARKWALRGHISLYAPQEVLGVVDLSSKNSHSRKRLPYVYRPQCALKKTFATALLL